MRISDWSSDVCSSDLRLVPEMPDPVHLVAALGVALGEAETSRQAGEDLVVRPAVADPRDRLLHGDAERLPVSDRDVVALQRRGRLEDDVGLPLHHRPPDLVDADRLKSDEHTSELKS